MIDTQTITEIVNGELGAGELFLVDVNVSAGNDIEVFVDCDGQGADGRMRGVSVEDCIALTKAVEARLDRDAEDFSLTVSSAGIGQPLKVARQYRKLTGRQVEVVMATGSKFVAMLDDFRDAPAGEDIATGSITLSYPEKQKIEGKKRPETITVTKKIPLAEIKTTKEYIDFK